MFRRQIVIGSFVLLTAFAGRANAQTAGEALGDILSGGAFLENETDALIALFQAQLSTFPLGSSGGGFTWTFDPQLGVAKRRSNSFGPSFAERPLTNGRGKFNASLVFQHTGWQSLAGKDLDSGGLRFTAEDSTSRVTFGSTLNLSTTRTVFAATYGVNDRLDVGVVVPFGHASVDGSSRFILTALPSNAVLIDEIEPAKASSSGVGDIELRAKAALPSMGSLDLAAGLDLRLPTGDEEKLLGTGKTSARLMGIGALNLGNLSPHVNIGYTFAGSGIQGDVFDLTIGPTDEVVYAFGIDVAATPTVTVVGDVIGRVLRHSATVEELDTDFLVVTPDKVNLLLGTFGAKINLSGMWLLNASIVFPLNDNGVKPGVTSVVGLERAF